MRDNHGRVRATLTAATIPGDALAQALADEVVLMATDPGVDSRTRTDLVGRVREFLLGWIATPRTLLSTLPEHLDGQITHSVEDPRHKARLHARRREWVHDAIADAIEEERSRCASLADSAGDPDLATRIRSGSYAA